jgi:hypothetical protein
VEQAPQRRCWIKDEGFERTLINRYGITKAMGVNLKIN